MSPKSAPIQVAFHTNRGKIAAENPPVGPVAIRNSVISGVTRHKAGNGDLMVESDHCLIWRPQAGSAFRGEGEGGVAFSARNCLFECDALLSHVNSVKVTIWTGSQNHYRIGLRPWLINNIGSIGLDTWRRLWKSDADSSEGDPLEYDPRQWQLLPISAGYRQTSEGRDYGADVSRIGRATP